MSLVCCNITFRTQAAFQEHRTIHTRGSHVFECRKCTFKCPKIHLMVAHNIVHKREKIAVLEEESKLVNKPWFVPNSQGEIQLTADNTERNDDKQKYSHPDDNTSALEDLDVDSSGREETKSLSTLDRDLTSDKNDCDSSGSEDTGSLSTLYRDSDSSESEELKSVSTLDRDSDSSGSEEPKSISTLDRDSDSSGSEEPRCVSTLDRDLDSSGSEDTRRVSTLYRDLDLGGSEDTRCVSNLDRDFDSSGSEEPKIVSPLHRDLDSDTNDLKDIDIEENLDSCGIEDTRCLSTLNSDLDSDTNDLEDIDREENLDSCGIEDTRCLSTLNSDLDSDTNDLKDIDREENLDSSGCEDTRSLSTLDRDLVSDKKYFKAIDSEKNFVECQQISNSGDLANKNSESLVTNLNCFICDKVFQEESLYEDHVRNHVINANLESNISSRTDICRFACLHCEFKCEDIYEYDLHKKTHYKNEAHVCKKCSRNFETKSHLQRHYIKVHKTYICQLCPFESKHYNYLKKHVSLTHSVKKNSYLTNYSDLNVKKHFKTSNTSDDGVNRYFRCLTCEKRFSCKQYLQKHMKVHSNEKPFQCALCSYKSMWKRNLKVHMKQHSRHLQQEEQSINEEAIPENIFLCDFCEYQTKDFLSLKIHIEDNHPITDTIEYCKTERLFHCNLCEYKSKFRGNVNRHTLRHHKDEYIESNKVKKFNRFVYKKSEENNRENVITENSKNKTIRINKSQQNNLAEIYPCTFCYYKSIYKFNLIRHMSACHSSDTPKNSSNEESKSSQVFGCSYCEYSSKSSAKDVLKHTKRKHGKVGNVNSRHETTIIKKIIKTTKNIDGNESFEYLNQFRCSYCNYSSNRSSNDIHKHMLNTHGKDGDIILRKVV
ncbi:unnamed protein product, partial [Meganyctiphanes norvegica]